MAQLVALCFDARDPGRLADFWSSFLDRPSAQEPNGGVCVEASDGAPFRLRFLPSDADKLVPNRMHFDLTSESLDGQRDTVEKALRLGARHIDVGQKPEEGHVVLADPEGNEFCVIEPGNGFLAGCGFIGAVSCDGTRDVGLFWSQALGWPLVWDEGEETAIQSPRGGTKVSWGGPPLGPKPAKNRLHWDIAPDAGADLQAEVERLAALGARRTDIGQGEVAWVVMADPDDNEFCVLSR
jgi:catechol 2,3-dioxygenase-like lactoylglutathione lyase family enzyme